MASTEFASTVDVENECGKGIFNGVDELAVAVVGAGVGDQT